MKLETYLLALAVVGRKAIEPHLAPLRSWPATAWTMRRCPMTRCFVTMLAAKISSIYRTADVRRLTVLQHLDVEERGQWSARAAAGTSLGSVIHAVHRERDALWIAGALPGPVVGGAGASATL